MKHHESELQRACVRWFDMQYPKLKNLLFAIPNGGRRSQIEAAIMKGEGVRPGVPDLFLAVARGSFHGLFIEMKHGKGTTTTTQAEMMSRLNDQNYMTHVCRSIEEFMTLVNKYLTTH